MGDPEHCVRRRSLVRGLLMLRTDGDGHLAVVTDGDVIPRETARAEVARPVAVQPVVLLEDEAERSNQAEVAGDHRLECVDVSVDFGGDPVVAELTDRLQGLQHVISFSGRSDESFVVMSSGRTGRGTGWRHALALAV